MQRRWIVLAVPIVLLLLGYWSVIGGYWTGIGGVRGPRFGTIDTWVVSVFLLSLAVFLGLRPQLRLYGFGCLAILSAVAGFWLSSPVGWSWVHPLVFGTAPATPYGGFAFAWLLPFFPVGWLLLAASLGHWRGGLILYLGLGAPFALVVGLGQLSSLALGYSGTSQLSVLFWVGYLLLLWPAFVLTLLGSFRLFGRSFG